MEEEAAACQSGWFRGVLHPQAPSGQRLLFLPLDLRGGALSRLLARDKN